MKRIKRTQDIVKQVLEEVPEARNSDDVLYVCVCNRINTNACTLPFYIVMRHRKIYNFPPFESVRRSRQKLQAAYPELAGSDVVEAQREVNEAVVRDYARQVNV